MGAFLPNGCGLSNVEAGARLRKATDTHATAGTSPTLLQLLTHSSNPGVKQTAPHFAKRSPQQMPSGTKERLSYSRKRDWFFGSAMAPNRTK